MSETTLPSPAEQQRNRWIDVFIVSLVAIAPNLYGVFFYAFYQGAPLPFWMDFSSVTWQCFQCIALVSLIIWRSGEPFRDFGFPRFRFGRDLGLGLLAAVAAILASVFATSIIIGFMREVLRKNFYEIPFVYGLEEARGYQIGFAVFALLANSFAEEMAMRGFLMTRLEQLFGSPYKALALSSFLFASYHAYQGLVGFSSALVVGFVFGLLFIWKRSVWMLVVAHTILNLIYFGASWTGPVPTDSPPQDQWSSTRGISAG
jgi:membrane protease YdiL (CAAX protease family)